jgi:hypothetical protein
MIKYIKDLSTCQANFENIFFFLPFLRFAQIQEEKLVVFVFPMPTPTEFAMISLSTRWEKFFLFNIIYIK